jgi:polysaccharide biosynthesis/export protein
VDLMSKVSFCTAKRLDQLVILTFCLTFFTVGKMDGQSTGTPAAPTDPRTAPGIAQQIPAVNTPAPGTVPTPRNVETDISTPPTTDRQQPRSVTISVPIPPLTEFQQVVSGSTGHTLPIFGASLFNTTPSTFAPVDNIPVTPDYVIGPGDELRLQIWGQVNQRGSFIVDRTGSISLPEVGTIHVAGLQFSQLSDFLKSQLGRVYRNFDLNVNLGQLRSIQVLVVGQANKPGSYTIGSLSTLLNALLASGGPLPQGSLRDIRLNRGSETVTHFDLYDLLLHGDKSKDVRLEPGDVIFIPNVGPQVAVFGSVTTPAIYELHGEASFSQVVALAGGLTNVADGSKVRVDRIYKHAQRSELEFDFSNGEAPPVQDGDIITVNSIVDRFQNAVTLRGNIANPGRYQWHQGMRISDLIPSRESLITRNYYQAHDRLAQNSNDYKGPASEGALGIQSGAVAESAEDRGIVGANGGGNSVGATLTAGVRNFSATTDVILSAPDIDWDYAVIERQSVTDLTTSLLPFNLAKAVIDKDQAQDLELLSGDVVTVFSKADIRVPNSRQTKFVKLEGEFAASGVYSVRPGETLRQLLVRAGGLTPDAYLYASEFTRDSVRRVERQRIIEYADALEGEITARSASLASSALTDRDAAAAQESGAQARATLNRLRQAQPTGRIVFQLKPDAKDIATLPDLPLEDGDRFVVPKTPSSVSVQGQVYDANAFIYEKGKRVKDYLYLAGGPDRNADRKREFILRADGSVVSNQYSGGLGQRALFVNHNFEDIAMLPGDTIVVPPVVEKGSVLRNLTNIATIIEGFGLGAAAINVLK